MSLGHRSARTMDLAGIRLDEVQADLRPGVFVHPATLRGRLAAMFTPATPPPSPPAVERDHFAWHSLADLLPLNTGDNDA